MADHRAGKPLRVKRRVDIERIFGQGVRAADSRLTLFVVAGQAGHSRCATGVSRRHGGAVRRNRVKRLCREAFRLIRDELPAGLDYMLIPRAGAELTLGGLQESLRSLSARLARRLAGAAGSGKPESTP